MPKTVADPDKFQRMIEKLPIVSSESKKLKNKFIDNDTSALMSSVIR